MQRLGVIAARIYRFRNHCTLDDRYSLSRFSFLSLVFLAKKFAPLLLIGFPNSGTSLVPSITLGLRAIVFDDFGGFPLAKPRSQSAYCTTFANPVFVRLSVLFSFTRCNLTLPRLIRSPRSAFLFEATFNIVRLLARSRALCPSTYIKENKLDGGGLAAAQRNPYRSPRVLADVICGSDIRRPVSWNRRLKS